MSQQVNTFTFEGRALRVVIQDSEPWWTASDVCAVLGLDNPTKALLRLDADEKSTLNSIQGGPDRNIINESGLYSLVLGSRKPEAKRFKKWVTSEVLPALRRTGSYQMPSAMPMLIDPNAIRAGIWQGQPWVCALDFMKFCGYAKYANLLDRLPANMKGLASFNTGQSYQSLAVLSLDGVGIFAQSGGRIAEATMLAEWLKIHAGEFYPITVRPSRTRKEPHLGYLELKPENPPRLLTERADFAEAALELHESKADIRSLKDRYRIHIPDLLADLMHLAKREGLDFETMLNHGRRHFQGESLTM